MNIFILVSPLTLGNKHQVQVYSFKLLLTFYHMSWSIAIILYREYSIVICIESWNEGIVTPIEVILQMLQNENMSVFIAYKSLTAHD